MDKALLDEVNARIEDRLSLERDRVDGLVDWSEWVDGALALWRDNLDARVGRVLNRIAELEETASELEKRVRRIEDANH